MSLDNPTTASGPGAPPARPFVAPSTDTTLSEALITLRKRRWVLILLVLAGLLFGFYKAVTQIRLYESFGRIEVRAGASDEYKISAASYFGDDPQRKMSTEEAILMSDTLLTKVARDLNLANDNDFLGVKGPQPHHSMDDPAVRQTVLGILSGGLHVAQVPKTDIIRISFLSLNAKLSADVVNKVIEDYIHRSYETRFDATQRVSAWLSSQLEDLKKKVENSQQQMMDLQRKLGTLGFSTAQTQNTTSSLDDLAKAAGQAKLNRILAEARYRQIIGLDPNTIEGASEIPGAPQTELTTLRTDLATARASYAEQTTTLGPNHPLVRAARARMDELAREVTAEEKRLEQQAKLAFNLAQANENQTDAALEQQKTDAYKLRNDLVEYTIRQREFESSRTLYEGLLQKLATAGVDAGLESMEIDIVDSAVAPVGAILKPQSPIVLCYGLLGAVLGIVLAFVLESLDTGLRSVAEIESVTELPSLAIIPRSKRASPEQMAAMSTVERNINVLTQPKSQFTEAFRSLRTALLLSTTGGEPRLILCTSATPSEGKTTAAAGRGCC